MDASDIFKIGLSILSSLGGATLILFAFSSWLGKIWANRILETERGKLASEIELIKTNNQNFINALGVSNSLYVESQKIFAAEKIAATKILWQKVLELRNDRHAAITFLDILVFKEYGEFHENSKYRNMVDDISIEKIADLNQSNIDKIRPFIDEKSYSYFWSYRALCGRLLFYIQNARDDGQPKKTWQEDNGVIEIVRPILDEVQFNRFTSEKWSTIVLFGYIEASLAKHLRETISGVKLSRESLDHSMALSKAAENLRKIQESEKS